MTHGEKKQEVWKTSIDYLMIVYRDVRPTMRTLNLVRAILRDGMKRAYDEMAVREAMGYELPFAVADGKGLAALAMSYIALGHGVESYLQEEDYRRLKDALRIAREATE